jgi:Flp pilus assembly protein TadG
MTMLSATTNRLRSFLGREDGTQMIEFAIVLPVLLLLFAGATELGRMYQQYTTLSKGTRAAARYLSNVQSVTTSAAAAQNIAMCGNATGCGGAGQPEVVVPGLQASNVVITPPAQSVGGVNYVTVEIDNYTYDPLVFDLNVLLGSTSFSVELDPGTTMRRMR